MSRNRKVYDLVVKTGTYEDEDGVEKKRWKNVGAMMEGDYGPFLLIDSTFNFAALVVEPGGQVLVSMFEANRAPASPVETKAKPKRKKPAPRKGRRSVERSVDDDIPF